MSSESRFWDIFGKFSAVVATVGTVIGIWFAINQSSEDIELYVESDLYVLDPILKEAVKDNFEVFSYSKLNETFKNEFPEKDFNRSNIVDLVEKIHKESWGEINQFNFDDYKGFSYLIVSNTGTKTAREIKIDLPISGIALQIASDDSRKIDHFKKVIAVDDIRAGNQSVVAVWSETEVSKYRYKDINVTHKNGVGSVSWPIKASGLGWYFTEYSYFIPLFIYVIFLIGGLFGSSSKRNSENEKKDNEQPESKA